MIKNLFDLINGFSKVEVYKITQNPLFFLHINSKHSEKKLGKIILLTKALKTVK